MKSRLRLNFYYVKNVLLTKRYKKIFQLEPKSCQEKKDLTIKLEFYKHKRTY
jgi:hypothetical protein